MMLRSLKKKIAGGAEEYSGRRLSKGFSAMEAALGEVYCHLGRALLRGYSFVIFKYLR